MLRQNIAAIAKNKANNPLIRKLISNGIYIENPRVPGSIPGRGIIYFHQKIDRIKFSLTSSQIFKNNLINLTTIYFRSTIPYLETTVFIFSINARLFKLIDV